jgi:SAM-dependent methyltransferase
VERCRAKGLKAYQCDVPELKSLGLTFDSAFAMNSLVHVPRGQLQEALNAILDTLKPTGLFYWGQYGGEIREGVYEEDTYEPKRFFSLLDDEGIQPEAVKRFELLEFDAMVTRPDDHLHYQSLILRAKHGRSAIARVQNPRHARRPLGRRRPRTAAGRF